MTDVLVFGDSHTAALRRGQLAIEADGTWPADLRLAVRPLGGGHLATAPFFADRGDHAEVTLPEYRRQFDRLPRADDPSDMVYGVSALLHPVRVWRAPAWQDFAPADMALPDVAPVSSGTVRRLAIADGRPMLDLVALLRRIGRRVFAVEAPYPFRHHPALRRTPAAVVMRVDVCTARRSAPSWRASASPSWTCRGAAATRKASPWRSSGSRATRITATRPTGPS